MERACYFQEPDENDQPYRYKFMVCPGCRSVYHVFFRFCSSVYNAYPSPHRSVHFSGQVYSIQYVAALFCTAFCSWTPCNHRYLQTLHEMGLVCRKRCKKIKRQNENPEKQINHLFSHSWSPFISCICHHRYRTQAQCWAALHD